MFEHYKAKRAEQKAEKREASYEDQVAAWQKRRDACVGLIKNSQTYMGGIPSPGLLLKPGEAVFLSVNSANLVEDRKGAGHWEGRSSGVSLPVGSIGGRSIRYHVGASKGRFIPGENRPTAIDSGILYITSARIIFQGAKQTREFSLDKLLGLQHSAQYGVTVFSVSNRQKPYTFNYAPAQARLVDWAVDLVVARHQGTQNEFIGHLKEQLVAIDAQKPLPLSKTEATS